MTPREQVQELYRELDKGSQAMGDRRLAFYGQLRAQEYSHREAINLTKEHFHLRLES